MAKCIVYFPKLFLPCYYMTAGSVARDFGGRIRSFPPADIIASWFSMLTYGMSNRPQFRDIVSVTHPIIITMPVC
jgi:hypothetical protein